MKQPYYGIIYTISCKETHKILYVGQTISSIRQRWNQHWSDTRYSSLPNSHIRKYGRDKYYISEFFYSFDKSTLDEVETILIKSLNIHISLGGWNISFGGKGVGSFSEETKKKISRSKLKKLIATEIATGKEYIFASTLEAAKILKVNRSHISNVCIGARKSHKGYTFKYI